MQIDALRSAWSGIHVIPEVGSGVDVVRARNRIAALVLREAPHLTHVLWWDDDLWPEDIRIVFDMLETGHDVIGAIYTNRAEPVHAIHKSKAGVAGDVDVLEVDAVGFGFTLTSLDALRRLSAAHRKYTDWPKPHKVANIFGQLYEKVTASDDPEDEALSAEDFSFCKRWRDMGERVYVIGGTIIEHAGTQKYSVRDITGAVR